ncbi:MAG: hypothetical protein AMK73_09095 [Planctomycetes bacterium SM23_32]|nr:MAG: hypothetical protein AMK73_09095 [Planctomycetes bacterium SM23_32]
MWGAVVFVLSLLVNVFQYLKAHSNAFHLRLKRVRNWVTNRTVFWDVHLSFDCGSGKEQRTQALALAFHELGKHFPLQVDRDLETDKVAYVDGVRFQLTLNDQSLEVHLTDQRVPYRETLKLLDAKILPLIEFLEERLPGAPSAYGLSVRFGADANPYKGLFLQRFQDLKVRAFTCSFYDASPPSGGDVTVYEDSVSIVAGNRDAFRRLSERYLALGAPRN